MLDNRYVQQASCRDDLDGYLLLFERREDLGATRSVLRYQCKLLASSIQSSRSARVLNRHAGDRGDDMLSPFCAVELAAKFAFPACQLSRRFCSGLMRGWLIESRFMDEVHASSL